MPGTGGGKRLTPDEKSEIIAQRIARVPIRQVAMNVGCTTATVQSVMKKHWARTAKQRGDRLESERAEQLARLDFIAAECRRLAAIAEERGEFGAAARFLAEERQALAAKGKSAGLDKVQVEHTGRVELQAVRWVEEFVENEATAVAAAPAPLELENVIDAELVEDDDA